MNQIIRTGFQPITHEINFDPAKIKKGKDLSALHIRRVEELQSIGACKLIRSSCVRSYKVTQKPYAVSLDLSNERMVTKASCTCVSGKAGKCKHIFALIHRINTSRSESKTSFKQEWDKPSDAQLGKDIYAKPIVLAERYTPNKNFSNIQPYQITLEDMTGINSPLQNVLRVENMNREELIAKRKEKLALQEVYEEQQKAHLRECIMMLLQNSPQPESLYWFDLPAVEIGLQNFFDNKIKVNQEQILQICIDTVNQSESSLWFSIRNTRISASTRAHKIKTRTRKQSCDLAKDFLNSDRNVKPTASQEYGTKHEKRAVKEYSEQYNKVVRHVGVFIMPMQPWICGSPDGIVLENNKVSKILEIKCPSSCKNKPIFDSSTNEFNVGYLIKENGSTCLKESHQYYTQCQILMYITNLKECDLYVWSPKGSELVLVIRDEKHLRKVIPKIQEFYFNTYLPLLSDSEKENGENNSS